MAKGLKYTVVVIIIITIMWAFTKFYGSYNKSENNEDIVNSTKVFEEPEIMVYEIKGQEKFRFKKDDKEYNTVLEKLNSSLIEGYTSKEEAYNKGYYVGLYISDIKEEIYSKNAVLRLFYSDVYEIDIIFEEDSVLDIIYIENGKTSCFYGFENNIQNEIKQYVDSI